MERSLLLTAGLALLVVGWLASCATDSSEPTTSAVASRPAATQPANVWAPGKPYLCHRAKGKITIDAKDHPDQWAHAMVIRDFRIPGLDVPAKQQTIARLLWDDQNLYLHAVASDNDLRATLKGKFAHLWSEDVVELFLKPPAGRAAEAEGDAEGYYEFEVSPINAMIDLQIPIGRHTRFEYRAAWESGAPSAVRVKGTVENPEDTDEYYRVLLAIPWKNMKFIAGRPPKAGDVWRFLIPRCNLSRGLPNDRELSACAPLPKPDFHMYDIYPEMKFVE